MKPYYFRYLTIILVLTACSSTGIETTNQPLELTIPVEISPSPSLTPPDTNHPSTLTPQFATSTSLPPTQRSLEIDEAELIAQVPSVIDGCLLPCWNNLEPGRSSLTQIDAFFSSLGIDPSGLPLIELDSGAGLSGTYGFFMPGENELSLEVVEVSWSDEVETIQLWYTRNTDLYSNDSYLHPHELFFNIGNPDSVSLYLDQGSRYLLYFGFQDSNTAVLYEGYATGAPGNAKICLSPNEDVSVKVRLYSDALKPFSPDGMSESAELLVSPEVNTNFNKDTFLQIIGNLDECIPLTFQTQ